MTKDSGTGRIKIVSAEGTLASTGSAGIFAPFFLKQVPKIIMDLVRPAHQMKNEKMQEKVLSCSSPAGPTHSKVVGSVQLYFNLYSKNFSKIITI
jgi:hypothetical protein